MGLRKLDPSMPVSVFSLSDVTQSGGRLSLDRAVQRRAVARITALISLGYQPLAPLSATTSCSPAGKASRFCRAMQDINSVPTRPSSAPPSSSSFIFQPSSLARAVSSNSSMPPSHPADHPLARDNDAAPGVPLGPRQTPLQRCAVFDSHDRQGLQNVKCVSLG